MIRRVKRSVCRLLIGILLFAQMAIAAYACPQLSSAMPTTGSNGSAAGSDPAMAMAGSGAATPVADMAPGCPEMGQPDPDNPNLCVEHVRFGQQSDQTQTSTVPAILLSSLYNLPLLPEPAGPPRSATASAGLFAAASPPHAILHCCFRI